MASSSSSLTSSASRPSRLTVSPSPVARILATVPLVITPPPNVVAGSETEPPC
jgi:hypothetical protein